MPVRRPRPAPESALAEQVQKLAAEKQDLTNTLVRLQADFDNYRKRTEKERDQEQASRSRKSY